MCLVHLFISISGKYADTHSKTSHTPWHLWEMKGSRKADTHASFLIVHLCYFCFWRKSFYGGLHSSLPFKNGENSDFLDHSRLLLHTSISRFCVFLLGLLWWDCWPLVTDPVTLFSFHLFFGSFVFSVLLLLVAISVFYFPQFCLLWGSSALYPPITADSTSAQLQRGGDAGVCLTWEDSNSTWKVFENKTFFAKQLLIYGMS